MSFFPNTKIKVEREVLTGRTDIGSAVYTKTIIIDQEPVMLIKEEKEKLKNNIIFGQQGQSTLTIYMLSTNSVLDIESQDIVTDYTTGNVFRVIEEPYFGVLIPQTLVKLKLGIEKWVV